MAQRGQNLDLTKLILGITGTIGCGKSTVFSLFRQAGWQLFDADGFCRSLYDARDRELTCGIRELLGDGVISSDGSIDRRRVADAVFGDQQKLDALTALIHPRLKAGMSRMIDDCRRRRVHAALEIPLLYESGCDHFCDKVLVVWCDPAIRHRRLMEHRGFDAADISQREAKQMPDIRKLELADYVLTNNSSPEALETQFRELLPELEAWH